MLYLTDSDVSRLISMPEVMELVDRAFQAQGKGLAPNQPRRRIFMPKGTFHVMYGALVDRGFFGLKTYTTFPGLDINYAMLLWDANTSELLGMMNAHALGQLRTGAASGVAAGYMARKEAAVAGLFGTGVQAGPQLEALCVARPLKTVKVYSRKEKNRQKFVSEMKDKVPAELVAVRTPSDAVKGSDIVCTITVAQEPVFDGGDLDPGTTVIAAGTSFDTAREVDIETVRKAASGRIATDSIEGAQIECGELIQAVRANVISWGQVVELGLIASGRMHGRTSEDEINLFTSQGVAIEDVAIASEVYLRARSKNIGKEFDF